MSESRREGTVKMFNESKGYGFITADGGGGDLFVHRTNVPGGVLSEGQRVSFETERGPKGLAAKSVTIL